MWNLSEQKKLDSLQINKKKLIKEIIISLVAITLLTIYIVVNYFSFDKNNMFDNSLPGLWEIRTTIKRDGKQSTEKVETCFDEKTIEESKTKSVQEKLNFSGLICDSKFNRTSLNYGKFTASCSGDHLVDKTPISVKVDGSISSKDFESVLKIEYKIKNANDPEVIIELETNSKRISDCKK